MHPRYALFAVPFLLVGCGGSDGGTGTVDLAVTDAPVDGATAVVVQFDRVELKPADGDSVTFDAAGGQIDLLALQNGETVPLLEGVTVAAGRYNWMRLHVTDGTDASYIELEDGAIHPLTIPSADQSGLKLNRGFTVPQGGGVDFTIDFDLRKSVHEDANGYKLRPTLRMVQTEAAGNIAGTVSGNYEVSGTTPADADADPETGCAAYVYSGSDVVPDDEYANGDSSPLASAALTLDDSIGAYTYTVSFLGMGDYTVALTCDAAADQPDTDDDITFSSTRNATVTAGETVMVDFQ
ncbi:DUF4382 domain-containing protein [Thiohalomonas denitrificans]|uniref:DUF4382 domain-containing protein n=1 Tax=Thiohalomonas denitrificans TaxID=415747 RepID=UPI0026F11B40|nr:DUF4382 domain-containing protein [Thiohalomonas denitrificans]